MNYADRLKIFENVENLGGKAWEHAVICDFLNFDNAILDCTPHCTNYQQMIEMLIKHALETKSEFNAYPKTHNLNRLLDMLLKTSGFTTKIDAGLLQVITTCAEAYRYDFLLNCKTYWSAVEITKPLIDELLEFLGDKNGN
jgi:HEPN domain-containing protein